MQVDQPQTSAASSLDQAAAVFTGLRPRMFGIAYRMLGSAAEAEDVVQEVWVRWQTTDRTVVTDPPAFLATATTRLAINVAQSARARRETYVGPWLPEPVDTSADPALGAERGEALELAVLLLLEKLTPTERAAYILREAFDYPYEQIARIVQREEANTRQLVSRARKHITAEHQESVPAVEHQRLLAAFLTAATTGDLAALEALFAADVVSYSDGGGIAVRAARWPVVGRNRVARLIVGFAPTFWPGASIAWVEVNGRAGVLVSEGETPTVLVTISTSAGEIDQVLWMMNPGKLTGFAASPAESGESRSPG